MSLSYLGFNENGETAGIKFAIQKYNSISIVFNLNGRNKIIPLTNNLYERYRLINEITNIMSNEEEHSLKITTNKRKESFYVKYYLIILSYSNDHYVLSIRSSDFTFYFPINNISELLSSIKEDMIFPGDKFIGLEAIELVDLIKGNPYWKARCRLCGREIKITQHWLVSQKSCGCLNNYHLSEKERYFLYVDKQENVPKELQIRGTLGLDEEPCWLWTGSKDKKGYGFFSVSGKIKRVNRYILEIKLGRVLSPKMYSCHRCDNPSCVNPNHLFEGTQLDNMQDMAKKKRSNRISKTFGENHYFCKISKKQVDEIKEIRGLSQKEIANKYNINQSTVWRIINGKRRKHG